MEEDKNGITEKKRKVEVERGGRTRRRKENLYGLTSGKRRDGLG